MKNTTRFAVAALFSLGLVGSAAAQSLAPSVPNPANPTPANPIATDGSPLRVDANAAPLQTGRSVFFPPVGGYVGALVTPR